MGGILLQLLREHSKEETSAENCHFRAGRGRGRARRRRRPDGRHGTAHVCGTSGYRRRIGNNRRWSGQRDCGADGRGGGDGGSLANNHRRGASRACLARRPGRGRRRHRFGGRAAGLVRADRQLPGRRGVVGPRRLDVGQLGIRRDGGGPARPRRGVERVVLEGRRRDAARGYQGRRPGRPLLPGGERLPGGRGLRHVHERHGGIARAGADLQRNLAEADPGGAAASGHHGRLAQRRVLRDDELLRRDRRGRRQLGGVRREWRADPPRDVERREVDAAHGRRGERVDGL